MSKNPLKQEQIIDGDQFRRLWAEHGADWAYQIVRFLQGRRKNEIDATEIQATDFFARCNEPERNALLYVCSSAEKMGVDTDDSPTLRERDRWLMDYVDGAFLGHSDRVAELEAIPTAVAKARAFDTSMFGVSFEEPRLFQWIWERA